MADFGLHSLLCSLLRKKERMEKVLNFVPGGFEYEKNTAKLLSRHKAD
jgi:hypothetical protein